MRCLILVAVLAFSSCGALAKFSAGIDMAQDLKGRFDAAMVKLSEAKAMATEAKASADTNKDGQTSNKEWLAWLAGGGGLALLGWLKSLFSAQKRNSESDERKTVVEQEAKAMDARLAALESK